MADRDGELQRAEPDRGDHEGGRDTSDVRLTAAVCDRLADVPEVDASDVEVTVEAGEVTLTGTVPDRDQKRRSVELIEKTPGVREVHDNLRAGGSDAGLATALATSAMSTERP